MTTPKPAPGHPAATEQDEHEHRFWRLAAPLLDRPEVTRSTMMGLPCLRVGGAFFASFDRTTGALLVKLPKAEVDRLVADGKAHPFAPAGRRFREWAAIPVARSRSWAKLLDEAHQYVATLPGAPSKPRRR